MVLASCNKKNNLHLRGLGAAAFLVLVWNAPFLFADVSPSLGTTAPSKPQQLAELRSQATEAEQHADWRTACWRYDEMLRLKPRDAATREAFQRCLRRLQIQGRHNDRGYRQVLVSLTPAQALDVYEQVLGVVQTVYVERDKANLSTLFQHGLTELRFALEDEAFVREHLAGLTTEVIQAIRARLGEWTPRDLKSAGKAREQVLAVLRALYRAGMPDRPLFAVAVALEFAAGICSGLDEYTLFFNPSLYGDLQAKWRAQQAGVGLEPMPMGGQLVIAAVDPGGPAELAGLRPGMIIQRIDGQAGEGMSREAAIEHLRGETGTKLDLEVIVPETMQVVPLKGLVRKPIPTVSHEQADDIGVLKIANFHESTLQEVKEALAQLQSGGIKGLILDLRGNPGGSFKAAVHVAELFLPEGSLIVDTKGTSKEFNQPFRVGAMNPFALPVVVLVDGETASAAEVVAGSLKEHGRARLMGQTTFGKGSIQVIIPLEKAPLKKKPGAIRITVAKFFWPGRSNSRGIVPDDVINTETELFDAARQHLRAAPAPPMMMNQ